MAGIGGRRPGSRGCRGAPGVGGAGHARVNVRPAPAALTQFHQKLEGWRCRNPRAPDTRAETAVRAARDTWTGTSAGPAPPHSPAQVTLAEESQEEAERVRSMSGPLFCAGACVRVRELFSRPTGCGVTEVCVGGPGPPAVLHSRGVRAPRSSPSLPPGRPSSLEVSWLIRCLLLRPLPLAGR